MKRGSITPFCALCLMLVGSLLLVLLESARVNALDRFAELKAENGIDSVCAEFQPFLWKEYGLLFLDGAYGTEYFSMDYVEESLEEYLEKNMKKQAGLNLLSLDISDIVLKGFMLAPDCEGEAFLYYVSEREKENLPLGIAEDLYEQYQNGKELETGNEDMEYELIEAEQVIEDLDETQEDSVALKTIFDPIRQMKSKGTLDLILESSSNVSDAKIESFVPIQNRNKVKGNMPVPSGISWYRRILVSQYMETNFSNFCETRANHFLQYEMEYVLCGKDSDSQNLSSTLEKLILLRQAYNMASLIQDETKLSEAETLANAIGIFVGGNQAIVKAIYAGLLVAWSYVESVSDVRALVTGHKITLIKSREEWTTNFLQLPTVAKNCERGMDYVGYLKQLLFFVNDKNLAYRMMEVMEFSLHQKEDYKNCRMNRMIIAMHYQIDFCTTPLFYSLAVIGDSYDGKFYFRKNAKRSYVP